MVWADGQVRAGHWPQLEVGMRSHGEISGLRVGIVGFGAVGSLTASLFAALGCEVAYWTRTRRPDATVPYLELSALCARSDILVLCLPLTAETRGLISAEQLSALPADAILVDVGRGGVLDQPALYDAVRTGHLSGAALDVYAEEPLPMDHPLRTLDRVLLSPHAGGASRQAVGRVIEHSVANLRRVLDGEPVINVVNDVSPVVKRR
jgi:D-3-phosphoglycerate dehydrogenase